MPWGKQTIVTNSPFHEGKHPSMQKAIKQANNVQCLD